MINSSVRRAGPRTGSVEQLVLLLVLLLVATQLVSYHTATATSLPSGTFTVAKRMYIETCLARFDVHLNTIIRTEASQSMGARYLDEADVNSREQCLRLCCETENCDVYVFEEKSPGTCFLFQCGPPENFRCKFTRHSNYTSAVLSIPAPMEPQPSAPLAAQIRALAPQPADTSTKLLSQNEMELVSLKDRAAMMGANSKHRSNTGSGATTTTLTTTTTTTTTPLPPLGVRLGDMLTTSSTPPTPKQQPRLPPSSSSSSSSCGIFEFSCHSGDCIAVYNVCDGIPQCEDGSDEGAECPQKNSGPILSAAAPMAVATGGRTLDEMPSAGMVGYLNQPVMMQPNGASSSLQQQGGGSQLYQPIDFRQPPPPPPPNRFIISPEQQQQQQQQQAQVLSKQMLMHRNREDPMTAPKAMAWPRSGFNEFSYEQPINNGGHIFSHKGGLQLGSGIGPGPGQQQQQQQYQEPALPDANYRSASSMDLAGSGGTLNGNGGQLYLPVPGSPYGPGEQEPKQLSQQQQQALSSQSQWRTMWSPQQVSAHVPSLQLQPQEQYIQPPIQQRPPDTMIPLRPNPMSGLNLQQEPNGAGFNRGPPNPLSVNGQWARGGDAERTGLTTVVPTAFASSISALKPQATDQELAGSKAGTAVGGPGERSDLSAESTGNAKPGLASAKGTGNADVEYEDDDLEGPVYPETTNSDGTGRDAESAQQTSITEAPAKKPHKHHKHEHQQVTGSSNGPNGSEGGQHGGTGGGKKKKKTKTIKKDKVPKADDTAEAGDTGYTAVHEHLKAMHQGLQIEFADHDGYADRPGGAMLSLTLGVLLTAALGILLSCRMRVARRRVRRPGKSSYAHDADFLVNGMYL